MRRPSFALLSALLSLALLVPACGSDGDTGATNGQGAGGFQGAGASGQGAGGQGQAGSSGQAAGGQGGGQGGGQSGGGQAGQAGQGQAGGGTGEPEPLRVANLNCENFFNDKIDSPGALDEAGSTLTPAQYQAKLSGIARILAKMKADVILLQEIENDAVLADLQARPELGGKYVDRALFPGNDPRGIDVAALSALPFTKKASHKDEKFAVAGGGGTGQTYKYSRDCLEVHVQFNGREVAFLGVHFKAKLDDDPAKRLAEAQHTRFLADNLMKANADIGVIILGDFNDFPGSPPMNAIEGQDPTKFSSAGLLVGGNNAWTVKSSSAPGGLALHDDQRGNPVMTSFIDASSVTILHDSDLEPELRTVTDHAPVGATYQVK